MGAAWDEATDPDAFRDSRPVSHLEVGLDAIGVVGSVAQVSAPPRKALKSPAK
jgi:hypothetical protein